MIIHNITLYYIRLHNITIISHTTTWYYILLHNITCVYIILHSITWYYKILHNITWYCTVRHNITWYYVILHHITSYCMVLSQDIRQQQMSTWALINAQTRKWPSNLLTCRFSRFQHYKLLCIYMILHVFTI